MSASEPDDQTTARAWYGPQQRRRRQIQYQLTGKVVVSEGSREPVTPRPVTSRAAAGEPTPPGLLLRVLAGMEAGHTFRLRVGNLIIGRASDAAIQIDDDTVSSYHAVLTVTTDDVTIEDLGSTNGTSLNGTTIDEAQRLRAGDRLQLGNAVFMIEDVRRD